MTGVLIAVCIDLVAVAGICGISFGYFRARGSLARKITSTCVDLLCSQWILVGMLIVVPTLLLVGTCLNAWHSLRAQQAA